MRAERSNRGPVVLSGGLLVALASVAGVQAEAQVNSTYQGLEEIVVTAQKRAENILDVPTSLSVLSGDQLDALSSKQLAEYASYVPGLIVSTGGAPGQARILLRGVVSQGGSGSTVGTYIDDTPVGASSANVRAELFQLDLFPYDIERIEILRGPQGTLYGAGAVGGVLKYVTKAPDLAELEARVGAEASTVLNEDTGWSARASVNLPIVEDKLAARASYFRTENPGFIDNVATGEKDENWVGQEGGRIALLWQATEKVSVNLMGLVQEYRGGGLSVVDVFKSATAGDLYGTPQFGDLKRSHLVPEPYFQQTQFYTGTVDIDLGFADFTSASSYSKTRTRQISDITFAFGPLLPLLGFPPGSLADFGLALDVEKFTQELRLTSPTGEKIEWMIGAFFTDEDTRNVQTGDARTPSGGVVGRFTQITVPADFEEYAVFGNVTYRFSDRFDITAGLRWAENDQSFQQVQTGLLGSVTAVGESSDGKLTYMTSARFHPTDATMLYARVASGYRPGGANGRVPGAVGVPPTFEPDTLVNYELGVKSELVNWRGSIEFAVFQIDWDNLAAVQIFQTPVGGFGAVVNADAARSRGFEFTTSFEALEGLQLGLNASYTESELTRDALASLGPHGVKGARLDLVPEWAAALTADYQIPLGGEWLGSIGGGYRYVGDRYGMFPRPGTPGQPVIRDHFDAYEVVDAYVGIQKLSGLSVRLYAKNILDERAYINGTGIGNYYSVIPPRTLGLSLDYTF